MRKQPRLSRTATFKDLTTYTVSAIERHKCYRIFTLQSKKENKRIMEA